jgi:hypothetical protein
MFDAKRGVDGPPAGRSGSCLRGRSTRSGCSWCGERPRMTEAALQWEVDRTMVMRIRTVAKESTLASLAESRPGVKTRERDFRLEQVKAENARWMGRRRAMAGGRQAWRASGAQAARRRDRGSPGPVRGVG